MKAKPNIEQFSQIFFDSVKVKMKIGHFPSQTVEEMLYPVLNNDSKLMTELSKTVQREIMDILKVYPEIALKYNINPSFGYTLLGLQTTLAKCFTAEYLLKYILPIIIISIMVFPSVGIMRDQIPLFVKFFLTVIFAFSLTNIVFHRKQLMGNAVSITFCFLITMFWSQSYSLSDQIDQTYNLAQKDHMTVRDSRKFVWEKSSFAMTTINVKDSARAFASGLYNGRQLLLGESTTNPPVFLITDDNNIMKKTQEKLEQNNIKVYYYLGKWFYILKNVCITCKKPTKTFVDNQIDILHDIRYQYNIIKTTDTEKQLVNDCFSNIDAVLKSNDSLLFNKKQCKLIKNNLDQVIEYLSP